MHFLIFVGNVPYWKYQSLSLRQDIIIKTLNMFKSDAFLLLLVLILSPATTLKLHKKQGFINQIWDNIVDSGLPAKAIQTPFIQGLQKGNLNPMCYTILEIQDTFYLVHEANNWKNACSKIHNDFSQECAYESEKYDKYLNYSLKTTHLKKNGVNPN